jgi:G3E family GTPase
MTADERIPVHVLTGFLGSGKTTLLRCMLRDPAFAKTAVLINEFGEVGLDHLLVGAIPGAPVLLQSGCICCTIHGDLADAIRELHDQAARGAIPAFRRLIVETTGLADPTPILATITSDRMIRRYFRVGNVVATIDSLHAPEGLGRHPELLKQASVADHLVITKTDLAGPAQVSALRERLFTLNPAASVTEAVHGATDPDSLFRADLRDPLMAAKAAGNWIPLSEQAAVRHASGLSSFVIRLDSPVDWTVFALWFSMLVHRHGRKLLRVKGILDVAGSNTPVALHAVQHVIHIPEHLAAWPTPRRETILVFITEGMQSDMVEASLRSFLRAGARAA